MENKEQKLTAQIAGCYFNALVSSNKTNNLISRIIGIDVESDSLVLRATGGMITDAYIVDCKDYKLVLTALEDITDEDAIEVAKMNKYTHGVNDAAFVRVGKDILKRIFIDKQSNMCLPYESADYLRSKSYMIPFMGIDLFDAKIAVDARLIS